MPTPPGRTTRLARRLPGALVRFAVASAHAAVVGAFVLGYAARYVRPGAFTWPLQYVGIGLPYLALALAAVTVVRLRAMPRPAVWAHAALLALAAVRFAPVPSKAGDPRPDDLSLVTFNVPMKWGMEGEEKGVRMQAFAAAENPDVMAFQDVATWYNGDRVVVEAHLKPLVDSLGYRYAVPTAATGRYVEVPVFARVPVDTTAYRFLFRTPAEPIPTQVTEVRFRWHGRPAVLFNVHLRSYGERKPWRDPALRLWRPATWATYARQYRDAARYRAWEADTLRAFVARERVPVLVTGDFNTTPHQWAYARIVGAGLQDAFAVAGRGRGATYHTRLPVVRIDYVLASPHWHVSAARLPALRLSDHWPVAVRLRWRDAPAR